VHPPRNRKGEIGNPLPKAGASELYPNNHAVYSKNRERLLNEEIAESFFKRVLERAKPYMSDEHFTVDGTLIEAWASHKSFRPKDGTTREFVRELRGMNITPHVAQNTTNRRSAVDERTTRHAGYEVSQRKRKRVEQSFGWMKMIGMLNKVKLRGIDKVGWLFTFTGAAYNLCRLRNLMART
jgi:hypothetical protein